MGRVLIQNLFEEPASVRITVGGLKKKMMTLKTLKKLTKRKTLKMPPVKI